MPADKHNKWLNNIPSFPDLRLLLNNKRSALLDNTEDNEVYEYLFSSLVHANSTAEAEDTARMILNKETIDFFTEGEDFFSYVWDRYGFEVYMAMLGMVKQELPIFVLANILHNFKLRLAQLQEQINSTEGPFPQQPSVSHQYFEQPFFPQASPISPMGSPNNHNLYPRRNNWSPFYQNCYPYVGNPVSCHRRRSHLDDVYLPNYDDEDLEERNGFNQQRFWGRPYNWYRNNQPQRSDRGSDHRNFNRQLSIIKRVQFKDTNCNDNSETKTNDLPSKDNVASSTSANSTDSCAKNCEAVKVTEVNSNLLKNELKSEAESSINTKSEQSTSNSKLSECENSAVLCHNLEENLKTEDISADSHSSDLTKITVDKLNSTSVPFCSKEAHDKMNTTEELQRHELLNNFHEKSNSSVKDVVPKINENKTSTVCEIEKENSFTAFEDIDSDEDSDSFGDFITIDKIDTSKSYLKTSPIVLDDYEVIDMDISPLKRKSECGEEDKATKKARYDNLYFKINSDKLLNEVNEVLKENQQSSDNSIKIKKRFRSKSLTLNDTQENRPVVRSLSLDSIDKRNFQVSYNFDLKTNLLLLLKPNSTHKEVSNSFNSLLKVLKDGDEKLSIVDTVSKLDSIKNENSNSNNSSESKSNVNINIQNDGTTPEAKPIHSEVTVEDKKDDLETFTQSEENQKKPSTVTVLIKADDNLQPPTKNNSDENDDTKENVKPISNFQSVIKNEVCIKSEIEKSIDSLNNLKRKCSVDQEEQPKKICLDSVAENIVQHIKASCTNENTKNDGAVKKVQSTEDIVDLIKSELDDTNQTKVEFVPLPDKTGSKGGCEESLVDIEEELKSLLTVNNSNKQQEKLETSNKEHVKDKEQKSLMNDQKIAADTINTDDKSSNNKNPLKTTSSNNTCTERSSIKESNQSQESSKAKKHPEKEITRKTNSYKERDKQTKNRSSSNSIQSKSKDESIRKQTSADKKSKCNEKIGNSATVVPATPNLTSQRCVNKSVLQQSRDKQNVSKSKKTSYYERFKRIQSLFGSDSESEIEEENLIESKTIQGVIDNYKNCIKRKMYTESNKRKMQIKKQAVAETSTNSFSQAAEGPIEFQNSVNLSDIDKHVKQFTRSKTNQFLKSSKVVEKRRCSVPITNPTPSCKFLEGAKKTTNPTIDKPKRIEKKRRETLPASLIGGISKDKPCQVQKSHKKEDTGKVCVIIHKLKDPRKEHHKYKSLEKGEQKSETNNIKKSVVELDLHKTQNKSLVKHRSHDKTEKRNISSKNPALKTSDENRQKVQEKSKENKPKNVKEKEGTLKIEGPTIVTIINQLQLQSKLFKSNQIETVTSGPKELGASKIHTEVELKLQNGKQEPVHIQLMQCSALPQDRFPMLQRARSHIQENDCCDKAMALEDVDVTDKIDIVKQIVDQEDDVVEVVQDIPIIDLTNDPANEKSDDLSKVEITELTQEISYKTDEMITLYRSEETVDNSLDIQPTSESISSKVLENKQSQSNKSNANKEFTSSEAQNSDLCNASRAYISTLSNNTANVSSPARFTFNIIENISKGAKIQNSNRLPSTNFSPPPPIVAQTVKSSELFTDTSTSQPRHAVGTVNIQTATNQINLTRQVSVEQRQDSVVNPPPRILLNRQNNPQPNSAPLSNPLAHLQRKVDDLSKPTSTRQNALLHHPVTMNSENETSHNVPTTYAYSIHSPMRHSDDEGPAPMHEISMQEIKSTSIVLLKYLLLYDSTKKAQWVYKKELLNLQKHMPGVVRLEIHQFENYAFEKDKTLYKNLIQELKSLNLTGTSNNIKSAEVLLEQVFKALHTILGNVPLWRVYLMLDTLMRPKMSEYMAVPFLRDVFSYVSFVARKIRSTLPNATQPEKEQIDSHPQDPFTPNQRKTLEWQIKQYISICSIQKKLTDDLQANIAKRLVNNSMATTQNTQQLPNYTSQRKTIVLMSNNNQSVNKMSPNLTVHQNIVIRPKPMNNTDTNTQNDTFRIRLPYAAPYVNPSPDTRASPQEQNWSQPVEGMNSQGNTANTQPFVNTHPSPVIEQTTESPSTTNNCQSADTATSATSPQQVETTVEADSVIVKQEKEAPLLTDQEMETIDLTWINDIDPEQLQSDIEFITVKKEEPSDDIEDEMEFNEESFAVAPSPADSGISSPPIQMEYDETVFSNRSCICEKVAEYVCGCMMAMYCSVECQLEDWNSHKDVCHKYKSKPNKPQQ